MFNLTTQNQIDKATNLRQGETRVGEKLVALNSLNELRERSERFVVLGACEDIGIRANMGVAGARSAWDYFLPAFCNVQANQFLQANNVLILGALQPEELLEEANTLDAKNADDLKRLRELTVMVDKELSVILEQVFAAGKIPILIGGGHNNAFPLLKASASVFNAPLSALNIDPHADYRALEGRHSGNGFSYAKEAGFLNKYAVWGLHEGYNNTSILDAFATDKDMTFQTFESLLWRDTKESDALLKDVLNWFERSPMGLELDMDSVEGFPASAKNVSGFSVNQVRQFVRTITALNPPVYFHICEASPELAINEPAKSEVGKVLAYLVTDFMKTYP